LRCAKCGGEIPVAAAFCPYCGGPNDAEGSASRGPTQNGTSLSPHARVRYAGFWLRAAAYLVDSILLGFTAGLLIIGPLMEHAGLSANNPWILLTGSSRQVLAVNLLVIMVFWLYFATMESSPWQATFGKRFLGLKVVDLAGKRITFARATGRYFAKMLLSSIFFIGFIMTAFTERKQALHDMLASTLVLRNF
jgi:uncharacterized RDD family membrane protein YckC